MSESYFSVKGEASGEYTEKKSIFLSSVCPVHNRSQALEYISSVKKKYSDARHNVYAYVTRQDNSSGYSDDGEPSGTGGVPVLDVIRKKNLTDVALVVTRYFGGILLGTGGLVRAYTQAASLAVQNAGISEFRVFSRFRLRCDYSDYGKVCFELEKYDNKILKCDYSEYVSIEYIIYSDQSDCFNSGISESTGGRIVPEFLGQLYYDGANI